MEEKEKVPEEKQTSNIEAVLVNIDTAAKYLGIGRDAVKRMMEVPDFPMIRIGNRKWVIKPKLVDWLMSHHHEDFGN